MVVRSSIFMGSTAPLYACYHRPKEPASPVGVVLVGAHGHEYVQFHRALFRLATLLANAGIAALRIDLAGCGDSGGDSEVWGLAPWSADVAVAMEELVRLSGVSDVGLIGVRLGASVVGRLEADRRPPFAVLWDPVVDGPAYLRELRREHRSMLRSAHVSPRRDRFGGEEEALGFPLPSAFVEELEGLALHRLERAPAPRVLLVDSTSQGSLDPLATSWGRSGTVRCHHAAEPPPWGWVEDHARIHVPAETLRVILDEVMDAAT